MLVTVASELRMVTVMSALRIGVIRMKNKERYAKDIVEIACDGNCIAVDKNSGKVKPCCYSSCSNCLFDDSHYRDSDCDRTRRKWAESEYVELPVISKNDRAFLDYLGSTYEYVVRDKDCKLFVCKDVHTDGHMWFSRGCIAGSDYTYISGFQVQFPMVKVVSPTVWSIDDLKKLEVVENYGTD